MIGKGQWTILPFRLVQHLPGLRLSPPGVVPQRERRPRWICDYTFSDVNKDTCPIAPLEAMQFGHALDRILRHILLANPALGPVHLLKLDISDGFYRVGLRPEDIPKLGVVFPTKPGEDPLVALPLVLPMGWKNSPPIFCAATETAADIANDRLQSLTPAADHPLDALAEEFNTDPTNLATPSSTYALPVPTLRDPSLPNPSTRLAYIDVFMDDFLGACQGDLSHRRYVRKTLLHAVDTIFRPLDAQDSPLRREPVSLKKLRQGDCSWATTKTVLGWIINTKLMTIALPMHRQERLQEILASIPPTQKRTSVKKWHRILGELRSMTIALPGARNLFSLMQNALCKQSNNRIALQKGTHSAIRDFQWLANDISHRPTRIAELVPTLPSAVGYHDASCQGAGGVWFPSAHVAHRGSQPPGPILWRLQWPSDLPAKLVSTSNPLGSITNSDLELAGGLLHLEAAASCLDVRERTIVSNTDNLAANFWQRNGSTTTSSVPAYLLRLFGIHQRFHRYVPRHDYEPGKVNAIADDASRLFHLSNSEFLSYFNTTYPQPQPFRLWQPTPKMTSCVISALRKQTSRPESLLAVPPPPKPIGPNGSSLQMNWAWMPFSKASKTKSQFSKYSPSESVQVNWPTTAVQSSLDRLRITYGRLAKRSSPWGPTTHR